MTATTRVEITKPEFSELVGLLRHCGEVVSFFLKPTPSIRPAFNASQPVAPLLADEEFCALARDLGTVAVNPGRYSTLNRLEFEGSLVAVARAGGCHRSTAGMSEDRIRGTVKAGLAAAFPEPFNELHVFRFDDEKWCQATEDATLFASYVVWQGARGLWWVLSISDID